MRHAILGAGGVGGLIGACLAHAGAFRHAGGAARGACAVSQDNFVWRVAFGNFDVDVAVAAEVPAVDVLWITVKATQLEPALAALKNPDAVRAIVPLLNGIDHISLLRARYGSERVIPATIAVETERVSPGTHRSSLTFCATECAVSGTRLCWESTVDQLQQIGFDVPVHR